MQGGTAPKRRRKSAPKGALPGGEGTTRARLLEAWTEHSHCQNLRSAQDCQCKKGSPYCLAGLLPKLQGFKKQGLWAKDTNRLVDTALAADASCLPLQQPPGDMRQDMGAPVGLINQGSTCYLNGLMQCLFMIDPLRDDIYNADTDDKVIAEFRMLFAQMQLGNCGTLSLLPLISLLSLDAHVQQDVQELFTLLLGYLERKLGTSKGQEVHTSVRGLLFLKFVYRTCCQTCKQLSDSSANETQSATITIPLQGFSSVEEHLRDMQKAEQLSGDNQFECSNCKRKSDATREFRIKKLPPYLCLPIGRLYYDSKQRKRLKRPDLLSLPLQLDMRKIIEMKGEEENWSGVNLIYDLYGILYHKGTSAHSGHYVAHVKDSNQQWWRCDDSEVEALPDGPAACLKDLIAPSEDKSKGRGKGNKRQKTQPAEADGDAGERFKSSNAYMLFYQRKFEESGGNNQSAQVPDKLAQLISQMNEQFRDQYAKFQDQQQKGAQLLEDRQKIVTKILDSAPLSGSDSDYRWISWEWLKAWADSPTSALLTNAGITCPHNKLNPSQTTAARRISVTAWDMLAKNSGPDLQALGPNDLCEDCCELVDQSRLDKAGYSSARARVADRITQAASKDFVPSTGFYISRTWAMSWKNKKGAPRTPSTTPTKAIACPHHKLLPDKNKSRRVPVSEADWQFIISEWQEKQKSAASIAKQTQDSEKQPAAFIDLTSPDDASLHQALEESKRTHAAQHAKSEAVQMVPEEHGMLSDSDSDLSKAIRLSTELCGQAPVPPLTQSPAAAPIAGLPGAWHESEAAQRLLMGPHEGEPPQPASAGPSAPTPGTSDFSAALQYRSALIAAADDRLQEETNMNLAIEASLRRSDPAGHQGRTVPMGSSPQGHSGTHLGLNQAEPNFGAPPSLLPLSTESTGPQQQAANQQTPTPGANGHKLDLSEGPYEVEEFPVSTSTECDICCQALEAVFKEQKELKSKVDSLKRVCPMLTQDHSTVLEHGTEYCVLPANWVIAFRQYLCQPALRSDQAKVQELPSLAEALDQLLCPCHRNLLAVQMRPAVQARGKWSCEGLRQYFVAVLEEGLALLLALCPALEGQQPYVEGSAHPRLIIAWLEDKSHTAKQEGKRSQSTKEPEPSESALKEATNDLQEGLSARGVDSTPRSGHREWPLMTRPAVCPNAAPDLLPALSLYEGDNAKVTLELVTEDTLTFSLGTRQGSRNQESKLSIPISTTTSPADLKEIFAHYKLLVKRNLKVYALREGKWELLDNDSDSKPLRELGIQPGSQLHVIDTGEFETDPDHAQKAARPEPLEYGFKGTLLSG